jgi:hypothetical protein
MTDFTFDDQKSPDENIEDFFIFLESINAGYAKILKENIQLLTKNNDSSEDRNQTRQIINKNIASYLDNNEQPGE